MAPTDEVTDAGPEQRRREFGAQLRALRRRSGLTGDQLAERLGWSQAKVSKTETGKTMPTIADIQAFAAATGASRAESAELADRFAELAVEITGWRTLLRSGIVGSQARVAEIDQATAVLRQLSSGVVPGLLQTAEYARSMLSTGPKPAVDVVAGVAGRLRRQEVLYADGKEFRFLLMEDALRRMVLEPSGMAVQIDRVSQVSTLRNVSVSVVAQDRRLPLSPLHGFRIHDDDVVSLELETGAMRVHDRADIEHYLRIFDALDEVAEHGDEARRRLYELAAHYRDS